MQVVSDADVTGCVQSIGRQ